MNIFEEYQSLIIGLTGVATTLIALNKEGIQAKVFKNESKLNASEKAVKIMQDVLVSVRESSELYKQREDECQQSLTRERAERQEAEQRLTDAIRTLEQKVDLYYKRILTLEKKYNV